MPSKPVEGFAEVAGERSTRVLARQFSQTEDVIRRWRSELGIRAPLPAVREFQHPELTLNRCILTSDWHVPYHDPQMVKAVIREAQSRGITDVVLMGDGLDFPTISRFDARDIDSHVGMELSAMGDVLSEFHDADLFIWWFRGNHELRYFKMLKHQVDIQDLIRACVGDVDWVHGFDVEEVVLHNADKTWLLSHPQDYSIMPLRMARTLSEKYGLNVAQGHSHMFSYGHAPNGLELLDTGGLFDPTKLAYLWRGGATKFPKQQQGFVTLDEGKVIMS